jgi:hypothetical protein
MTNKRVTTKLTPKKSTILKAKFVQLKAKFVQLKAKFVQLKALIMSMVTQVKSNASRSRKVKDQKNISCFCSNVDL